MRQPGGGEDLALPQPGLVQRCLLKVSRQCNRLARTCSKNKTTTVPDTSVCRGTLGDQINSLQNFSQGGPNQAITKADPGNDSPGPNIQPQATSRAPGFTGRSEIGLNDGRSAGRQNQRGSMTRPNAIDRRYIISPDQFLPEPGNESTDRLLAPVTETRRNEEDKRRSNPEGDEMAAMANDVKEDGIFRRVHIRYDNDPEDKEARLQCIMHDTGAGGSLTFENKLNALDLTFVRSDSMRTLVSVTGDTFTPIGRRQIFFSYQGRPDKIHSAYLYVLPTPSNDMDPSFDFLFGRDVVRSIKAITWDYNTIGEPTP